MHAAVQTTLFLASDGCDVTGIQGQNPLSLLDERNPPFIVYYYNHRAQNYRVDVHRMERRHTSSPDLFICLMFQHRDFKIFIHFTE